MSAKHTPGPWHFTDHTSHNTRLIYGIDGCMVADAGRIPHRSNEEMTANALLIAAAPELLAACESALSEAKERDEDMGANCWPQVAAAIALAKVKGGDSQ